MSNDPLRDIIVAEFRQQYRRDSAIPRLMVDAFLYRHPRITRAMRIRMADALESGRATTLNGAYRVAKKGRRK